MWQRFTERARKVVFYAQEEAQRYGEGYVSTEHLLLGLCREDDSTAMRALAAIGLDGATVRERVAEQLPRGETRPGQDMTLTPRAKRVIDLAYDEARQFNNNYIGTEHLLLGLTREGDGLAGRVLNGLGVELERLRDAVLAIHKVEQREDVPAPRTPAGYPPVRNVPYQLLMTRWRILPLEHLALLLLADGSEAIDRMLWGVGVDAMTMMGQIEQVISLAASEIRERQAADQIGKVLTAAVEEAGGGSVGPEHVLLAVAARPGNALSLVLEQRSITVDQLRQALGDQSR